MAFRLTSNDFEDMPRHGTARTAGLLQDDRPAQEPLCRRTGEDLIVGRGVLELVSGRDNGPPDGITHRRTGSGDDDVAGLNTRPQSMPHPLACRHVGVQRMHRRPHIERGAYRAQAVVFVRDRKAEERDQLVAQGLLDTRAVTLENFGCDASGPRADASDRLCVDARFRRRRNTDSDDADRSALER